MTRMEGRGSFMFLLKNQLSLGVGVENRLMAEKNREMPSRVPTAQRLSLGHSSTNMPPRIAVTTPSTRTRPLAGEELAAARSAGFQAVSLGPRVLRTETAGLAAIAALQALAGDF